MWGEVIAAALIVLILGLAVAYILRAKKRGQRCIGCPSGGSCKGCNGACGRQKEE